MNRWNPAGQLGLNPIPYSGLPMMKSAPPPELSAAQTAWARMQSLNPGLTCASYARMTDLQRSRLYWTVSRGYGTLQKFNIAQSRVSASLLAAIGWLCAQNMVGPKVKSAGQGQFADVPGVTGVVTARLPGTAPRPIIQINNPVIPPQATTLGTATSVGPLGFPLWAWGIAAGAALYFVSRKL